MKTLVQATLRSGDTWRTCWVEDRVHAGDQITLKNSEEPARRWDVMAVSQPRASTDIRWGWHNNI